MADFTWVPNITGSNILISINDLFFQVSSNKIYPLEVQCKGPND